jgi:hypothetical protein
MRNIPEKIVDNQDTFVLINFFPENRTVCKIMWNSTVHLRKPQMTIQRMRSACWKPNATTHTQNMQYLLLFYGNNGCTNALQSYVIRALPVLFMFHFYSCFVPVNNGWRASSGTRTTIC